MRWWADALTRHARRALTARGYTAACGQGVSACHPEPPMLTARRHPPPGPLCIRCALDQAMARYTPPTRNHHAEQERQLLTTACQLAAEQLTGTDPPGDTSGTHTTKDHVHP